MYFCCTFGPIQFAIFFLATCQQNTNLRRFRQDFSGMQGPIGGRLEKSEYSGMPGGPNQSGSGLRDRNVRDLLLLIILGRTTLHDHADLRPPTAIRPRRVLQLR